MSIFDTSTEPFAKHRVLNQVTSNIKISTALATPPQSSPATEVGLISPNPTFLPKSSMETEVDLTSSNRNNPTSIPHSPLETEGLTSPNPTSMPQSPLETEGLTSPNPTSIPQSPLETEGLTSPNPTSMPQSPLETAVSNENKPEFKISTNLPLIPNKENNLNVKTLKGSPFLPNNTALFSPEEDRRFSSMGETAIAGVDRNVPRPAGSPHTDVAARFDYSATRTEANHFSGWGAAQFGPPADTPGGQNCNFSIPDLGDYCGTPSWACRGRCGEDSATSGALQPGTCHCSHMCLVYSSCCEDFERECPVQLEKAREELGKFDGTGALCSDVTSFKLISQCPNSYPHNTLRTKCEYSQILDSFEMSFPVTDSISGHHFRNKACWECWQGRLVDFGEPLVWGVSVELSTQLDEISQYSPQTFLSHLNGKPDKSMWQPPAGYTSFYCIHSEVCSECALGSNLTDMCYHSPASFLQVGTALFTNRYCFLCSDYFGKRYNNTPADQIECQVPNTTDVINPGYNMFEFTVIFSLRGLDLQVDIAKVEAYFVPNIWKALKCDVARFRCDALSCVNGLQPQNGRCQSDLTIATLWVQVCFGAHSAAAAASRAGTVNREFHVLSVNFLETSEVPEFYIEFVYNLMALRNHGNTRLRNCMLLAVLKWLSTMPLVPFETEDVDADNPKEQPDSPTGGNQNTEHGENVDTKETYICIQMVVSAFKTGDYVMMDENDCFLSLNFDTDLQSELNAAETKDHGRNGGQRMQEMYSAALVVAWLSLPVLNVFRVIK
ncbi:hypothetical protein EGW08_022692 [Elysia chlorotica]|uniref:SMB domain-containing protein n=1 Tax=Elysia chlorotica TaxID=188477 RepID=A0A3S1H020_ELYCH|nr:hypothetical protein EGW08_022692 [Elysia chlorotica]